MANYETKKNHTKFETIARRAKRAAKYANATQVNKAGRSVRVVKAAW